MISSEDKSDLKVAAEIRRMLASEGWLHYERLIQTHIKETEAKCLRPYVVARASEAKYLSKEDYHEMSAENKGALYALRLALSLPTAIMGNADDILAKVPPEQRHVIEENLE